MSHLQIHLASQDAKVFITCGTPENFTYCRGVVRPPFGSPDCLWTCKKAGECMQSWDIFFQGFPGINFCQMGLKHLTRMIFDPWGGDFKHCLCFAQKFRRRFPIWFHQTATTKLQTSLQKSRHPFRELHGKMAMNICEPWTSWDGIVMLVICACDIFSCWDILGVWASVPRDYPGLKIFWTQISVLLFLFQALSRRGGVWGWPTWVHGKRWKHC